MAYQVLLGSPEYEKGLLGVYLYRLATFIFIDMVKVASKKFSNMGVRMHWNLENSLIEVGWAHLKNGIGELHATHLIELLS